MSIEIWRKGPSPNLSIKIQHFEYMPLPPTEDIVPLLFDVHLPEKAAGYGPENVWDIQSLTEVRMLILYFICLKNQTLLLFQQLWGFWWI